MRIEGKPQRIKGHLGGGETPASRVTLTDLGNEQVIQRQEHVKGRGPGPALK